MSGETQRVYGTTVTLQTSGASVASAAISAAAGTAYDLSDDTPADYPDAEFALTCSFGGTPAANTIIALVIRPLDIDGTTDAPVPTATYVVETFGSFSHSGVNTTQTLRCFAQNIPRKGEVYLYNGTLGTSFSSWTLKMTPVSYKAVA